MTRPHSQLCVHPPLASHLLCRGEPLHVVGEVLLHLDLAARLLKVAPRLRLLPLLGKLSSVEKMRKRAEQNESEERRNGGLLHSRDRYTYLQSKISIVLMDFIMKLGYFGTLLFIHSFMVFC